MNIHIEGLETLHFILAYAGMLLHFLTKLGSKFNRPGFRFKIFFKSNFIPLVISIIGIPVLLIAATEPVVKEFLPINNVTAILAGWQTQSVFKTLLEFAGKKTTPLTGSNNGATPKDEPTPPQD